MPLVVVERVIVGRENPNISDPMLIAKFPSYQQAFLEVKQILEMSADDKKFATLPKITKDHEGWYVVSITVKKRKSVDSQ